MLACRVITAGPRVEDTGTRPAALMLSVPACANPPTLKDSRRFRQVGHLPETGASSVGPLGGEMAADAAFQAPSRNGLASRRFLGSLGSDSAKKMKLGMSPCPFSRCRTDPKLLAEAIEFVSSELRSTL